MRLFIRTLLTIWCSGSLLGAFAQEAPTTTRSGFAIVTLVSGNIAGLIATETLKSRTVAGAQHAVVAPAPLITNASMIVTVGPIENTTALAIANPSTGSGGVNLVLTDPAGQPVLNATFVLGPHGQISKYINEFFPASPAGFPTPLLLTVSSEIPIGILAFNFRGADFASIPLTSLSTPTPVPIQTTSSTPAPSTGTFPGFGIGLPPPVPSPGPIQPMPTPIPVTTTPITTTTPSIGGTAALVFPQIAVGGDWSTELAIGNTSAGTQVVRIDFFGSDGLLLNSLSDIVIQSRAVFFVSTDAAMAAAQ